MTSFQSIGVQKNIILGLEKLGFSEPTPVQAGVIPRMLQRDGDMIGLAQTGTGKTAAFGIPLLQLTDPRRRETQALVLCPTRELCIQVAGDMQTYGEYLPEIKITAVYGGANIERQIQTVARGAHIIVATPGRLNDLLRRGKVDLSRISSLVLDEADEMLQMGFLEELDSILARTPEEKNTLLFSATMSKAVSLVAGNYMKNPEEITIGRRNGGTENVQHIYYMAKARDRYPALKRIVDFNSEMYAIVFCRTRQETNDIAENLIQDGYRADALHGDLSQAQRDQVMRKFHSKSIRILVATDVAARGLDVTDLSHVINYNLPDDVANYTHRSGRTGRAGKKGVSIAIIHSRETFRIREIEKRIGRQFEVGRIPTGEEICRKQLQKVVGGILEHSVPSHQLPAYVKEVESSLMSLSHEDLIRRIVSMELERLLGYYSQAPDLNLSGPEERKGKAGKSAFEKRNDQGGFARFSLNVGKKDGLLPQRILGEINDAQEGDRRIRVGRIEIMKSSATLEADSRYIPQVLAAFQHLMINGKPVTIKVSKQQGPWKKDDRFEGRRKFKKNGAGKQARFR